MENKKARNIGYGIPAPAVPEKYDPNDPFYGTITVKKNNFTARVVSAKTTKSAVVEIERTIFNKKYQRYGKKKSRFAVHNPLSINAEEGDVVRVFETRPISKMKHHVIVQVLGQKVDIKGQDLAKEAKENKKSASKKKVDDEKSIKGETISEDKEE